MMQMGEKVSDGRRHALRNFALTASGMMLLIWLAIGAANVAPAGTAPMFSPVIGILIAAACVAGFSIPTWRYLMRTDEHDRVANLWSLSVAWLVIPVIAAAWWLLAHSSLLPPVDPVTVFLISAGVSAIIWTWLRFR